MDNTLSHTLCFLARHCLLTFLMWTDIYSVFLSFLIVETVYLLLVRAHFIGTQFDIFLEQLDGFPGKVSEAKCAFYSVNI